MKTKYFHSYYLYLETVDYLTGKTEYIYNQCWLFQISNQYSEKITNTLNKISIIITVPVFTPPVKIQAPVVTAALIRPFPSNCLIRGWSSNFCMPPCTEITSLGNSICHSLSRSCRMTSVLVSYDSLTY